jgi:hypothetical protein
MTFKDAKKSGDTHRDQDEGKGAIEDDRIEKTSNAPALDANGMPNDPTAIAEDALGAQEDESQG